MTEKTTAKVRAVAEKLGYIPSKSASSLASGKTRSVGLVVPAISRWFFATALEGAEDALREADYDALLYSLPDRIPPRKRFDADVLRSRVDAVLVASISFDSQEVEALRSLSLPAVFISIPEEGFPFVGIDDYEAAKTAVRHLIGLGHRFIGHISGAITDRNPASPTPLREKGWRDALLEAGLVPSTNLVAPTDMSAESGYLAADTLIERNPDMSAIFAASDETAMGAMAAIRGHGLVPGEDISVIGIDGHNLGNIVGLSTVAQPVYEQGVQAAQLLLDALEHGNSEVERHVFETELIQRASTAPARD